MDFKKSYVTRVVLIAGFALVSGFHYLVSPAALFDERAAADGDVQKQLELGKRYLEKRYSSNYKCTSGQLTSDLCRILFADTRVDTVDRGIYWLRQASDKGDRRATYLLALALLGEFDPAVRKRAKGPDRKKAARSLLSKLADEGHVDASYRLGWCFLRGVGGDIDLDQAVRYLSLARDNGHPRAQALLDIAVKELEAAAGAEDGGRQEGEARLGRKSDQEAS